MNFIYALSKMLDSFTEYDDFFSKESLLDFFVTIFSGMLFAYIMCVIFV